MTGGVKWLCNGLSASAFNGEQRTFCDILRKHSTITHLMGLDEERKHQYMKLLRRNRHTSGCNPSKVDQATRSGRNEACIEPAKASRRLAHHLNRSTEGWHQHVIITLLRGTLLIKIRHRLLKLRGRIIVVGQAADEDERQNRRLARCGRQCCPAAVMTVRAVGRGHAEMRRRYNRRPSEYKTFRLLLMTPGVGQNSLSAAGRRKMSQCYRRRRFQSRRTAPDSRRARSQQATGGRWVFDGLALTELSVCDDDDAARLWTSFFKIGGVTGLM
ncbi:hypothetical protein NL676_036921 [Syzygium grande]|nr:hypothetical protein NL676_036921 [Syzygium grande]